MHTLGLVSISFRKHSVSEIADAVKQAGLSAVEWGGDVHVPHGDTVTAKNVCDVTAEKSLRVSSYGSYYKVGQPETVPFESVLASAQTLGAKTIRVWAGWQSSDRMTNAEYGACVADMQRICDLAGDIRICTECHPNTLTDEYHTAVQFAEDVNRSNLGMFWQPNQYRNLTYNLDAIRATLPYLHSVHVFSWVREQHNPLGEGAADWTKYLDLLQQKDLYYMLEFMHDNRIETLAETAVKLKEMFK